MRGANAINPKTPMASSNPEAPQLDSKRSMKISIESITKIRLAAIPQPLADLVLLQLVHHATKKVMYAARRIAMTIRTTSHVLKFQEVY